VGACDTPAEYRAEVRAAVARVRAEKKKKKSLAKPTGGG
jgi:hypothetical protein